MLAIPWTGAANNLRSDTLTAWNDELQAAKTQFEQQIKAQQTPFLWIDEVPNLAARLRAGEIVVAPAEKGSPRRVPHGLIHDWRGGVFVPNATLDDVLRVMNDFDDYQKYYKPQVARSKLQGDDGKRQTYTLVLTQKSFGVTATYDTDNNALTVRIDGLHAYACSQTTRVQAIADFGKPGERELPQDTGPGYVWRLATFSRVEQRDGGVYLETEMMGMSRGIPVGFRWLIEPLTERLPREYATTTLRQTRDAVEQEMKSATGGQTTSAAPDTAAPQH
jgi:hypothetical protein